MLGGLKSVKLKIIGRATPTMTGATTPSGVVSASSTYQTLYPWHCFDEDFTTIWAANYTSYGTVTYQFPTQKKIGSIRYRTSNLVSRAPKDYTVEVSDDGTNWTTVLTVVGEAQLAVEGYIPLRKFTPTKCTYIRLNITDNQESANAINLSDIEYMEYA